MSTLQDKGLTTKNVRATVTGVDAQGQLFRDTAPVVFLKGQKCVYESKFRPSPDGELMVELPNGKESWRSNAKLKSISSVGGQPGTFRVTIELERAHSLVIEAPPEGKPQAPAVPAPAQNPSPAAVPEAVSPAADPTAPPSVRETKPFDASLAAPDPGVSAGGTLQAGSAKAPATTPKTMVADIVRSVMAAELAQLKREIQATIATQVDAALRKPLEALEAKFRELSRKQPAITEESVRQLATKAAQTAQREWAENQLQRTIAESVRAAMTFEMDQRRREFTVMVLGEIEAAVRGPISSRIDARLEEHARRRPAITEETVRRVAAQVAANAQLEWASTKLQKMIAEAVRAALAGESTSAKETGATGNPPRR